MQAQPSPLQRAFTLVEMLIVIAVIGIMAALVISSFSNAAQDTRRVVSRQQQAAVQNAVNAWVNSRSSTAGLAGARTAYNAATTSLAKLQLVAGYLDDTTTAQFVGNTSNTAQVQSAALKKTSQYLELSAWAANSYPKVELK
jgi:prepilin-type N-terminal cleavage/methylation domain-containing protein